MGMASVLRHLLTGGLVVALDFLVFWMLDQGRHLVKRDIVARGETTWQTGHLSVGVAVTVATAVPPAPVTVAVQVNGSGYASDIFRDLVAAFDVLQGGNVTVISRKCLLEPSQPDYATCFLLGKTVMSSLRQVTSWLQHLLVLRVLLMLQGSYWVWLCWSL